MAANNFVSSVTTLCSLTDPRALALCENQLFVLSEHQIFSINPTDGVAKHWIGYKGKSASTGQDLRAFFYPSD